VCRVRSQHHAGSAPLLFTDCKHTALPDAGAEAGGSPAAPAVVSRFFGPWLGINEDHVTGSAHAVLGPYYCRALGVQQFWARQCSARGGDVHVRVDWDAQRVFVSGDAVLVLSGTLSC
jgi:predicted PhzF superfamily epimerase YddE/YHI9